MSRMKAQATLERGMIILSTLLLGAVVVYIMLSFFSHTNLNGSFSVTNIRINHLTPNSLNFSVIINQKLQNPQTLKFYINNINSYFSVANMSMQIALMPNGEYEYIFDGPVNSSTYKLLNNTSNEFVLASYKNAFGKTIFTEIAYPISSISNTTANVNQIIFYIFPPTTDFGISINGYQNLIENAQVLDLGNGIYKISAVQTNPNSNYFFDYWSSYAYRGTISLSNTNSSTAYLSINNASGYVVLYLGSYGAINFTSNKNDLINSQNIYQCGEPNSRFCIDNSVRNLYYVYQENKSSFSFSYPPYFRTSSPYKRLGFIGFQNSYDACKFPSQSNQQNVQNIPAPCVANATYVYQYYITAKSSNSSEGLVSIRFANNTQTPFGSFESGWAEQNTTATFYAEPHAQNIANMTGYVFVNWTGSYSSASNPLYITITEPVNETANFKSCKLYSLQVSSSNYTRGSTTPSGTSYYCAGSQITIEANANSGYQFSNWNGTLSSTSNPFTFTLNSNTIETANFNVVPPPPPSNNSGGGSGSGGSGSSGHGSGVLNAKFNQALITNIYPINVSDNLLPTTEDLKIANFFVYEWVSLYKEIIWQNPQAPNNNYADNFSFSQVSLHKSWGSAIDCVYGDSKGAHFLCIGQNNTSSITFNFPSKFTINSTSNLPTTLYGNYTFNYALVNFTYVFKNGTSITSLSKSLRKSVFTLNETLAQSLMPTGYNASKVTYINSSVKIYYKQIIKTNNPNYTSSINIYNYPAKEGNNITIYTNTQGITLIPQGNQNNPDQYVSQYQYLINYNKNTPSQYTLYIKLNPNSNIPQYYDYSLLLAIYDNTTKSFITNNYQTYTQSQLLSSQFNLNTKDNYSIYAVYYIPVNITTYMLGSKFKFSTIGWQNVPYYITNSTSNQTLPYQSAVNSYSQILFILPPNDVTIYNYKQPETPILESGYWNNKGQFLNAQTILGDYGNPYGCLINGDISDCTGFYYFAMSNPSITMPDENYIFNKAYAIPSVNESNDQNLYSSRLGSLTILPVLPHALWTDYPIYGLFFTNVSNQTNYTYPVQGYFYPYYRFYNASISLNQYIYYYFDSNGGAVMNINAYYGYYIPFYQETDTILPMYPISVPQCNPNPGSIMNLINDAKNSCFEAVEDNLTFASSTQAIQINIPSNFYYWINFTYENEYIYYEKWDAKNNGLNNTLINDDQTTKFVTFGTTRIQIYPSTPSSGSQYNVFAIYVNATSQSGPDPAS